MWEQIFKSLSVYGPLGIVFFFYIKENFKRQSEIMKLQSEKESKNQENYQQLLNTVINTSNENIKKLEATFEKLSTSIEKSNNLHVMSLEDIDSTIVQIKDNCNTNCGQLFTALYEEKGMPKHMFLKVLNNISVIKVYQSVIDITTTIDNNGFETEENICLLKDNLIRIIEKRRHETLDEISKIVYDNEVVNVLCEQCGLLYKQHITDFKSKILNNINVQTLSTDKNYKRLKSTIKNMIFAYLDDLIKLQNDLLR